MSQKLICSSCGHVGSSKTAVKGNFIIEIILWLCFLIPGIIYSLWRSSSRYKTCKNCGSSSLIPLDSPMGKKLLADQGKNLEQTLAEKEPPRVYTRSQKLIFILAIITAIAFISFVANGI